MPGRRRGRATDAGIVRALGAPVLSLAVAWVIASQLASDVMIGQSAIIDRVMAVVEGDLVMQSDVDAAIALGLVPVALEGDARAMALQGLIDRRLMLREVERYVPLNPTSEAVDRRLAEMRERFVLAEDWRAALARVGLDDGGVRALARDSLRIEAYLEERFGNPPDPTDMELRAYYQEHRDQFTREGRVMSFADVRPALTESLREQRRNGLIGNWLEGLRRRADVRVVYGP